LFRTIGFTDIYIFIIALAHFFMMSYVLFFYFCFSVTTKLTE